MSLSVFLLQLLQLVGHEYLHQWNVRRLRPREFRPYDYGHPVVSEGLWFAEGITSYFDLVLPLLAGCSDRSTLLKDLSEELSTVRIEERLARRLRSEEGHRGRWEEVLQPLSGAIRLTWSSSSVTHGEESIIRLNKIRSC